MGQYVHIGESIDYQNLGTNAIKYGDVIALGSRIGVASADIAVGALGTLAVLGVFDMPAAGTEAFVVGDDLYWDGSKLTKTAGTNPKAGWCTLAKTAAGTVGRVKLIG